MDINISVKNYNTNQPIYRDNNTIGYKFVNTGNCIVYVNEVKLNPCDELNTMFSGMRDQTLWRCRIVTTNTVNQSCSTSNANLQVIIYSKHE